MNKMMLYKILRPLVYVLFKIVYKPEVINKEYIPKEGRCILAGTHTNIKQIKELKRWFNT